MSIIDPRQLLEHIEGDLELLQEAFVMFQEESDTMLGELRNAVNNQNADAVRSVCHSIKGMLSNFLAVAPCDTLEQIRDTETGNDQEAHQLVGELESQIQEMFGEIQTILDSGEA